MTEISADPAPEPTTAGFSDLGLPAPILTSLKSLGYKEPTPIQAEAIPPLMAGRDLLGQASTGTGKTAAFALPMLARVNSGETSGAPTALILVPTRELAVQVQKAIHEYARGS
ncbi:MAG: ATP-dependent helicase DeaD, partial [Actinomycetota bacterium]|nr:ATP-dependent helicase DeaD [Actinomycetota bacterium]